MGLEIERQAHARGHERVASVDPRKRPGEIGEPWSAADLNGAEVAFEFTTPAAAAENVRRLIDGGVAVVCGTTGWRLEGELEKRARDASRGVVVAPNFSVGMNLFYRVARVTGELFGSAGHHDPYVLEVHHRSKLDAPSGTARRLAELLVTSDPRLDQWKAGTAEGPAAPGVLPVASVRAGAEPGRHALVWDGPHDRVVIEHQARSRDGFALGAVLAAEALVGLKGLHSFDDLLDRILAERRPRGKEGPS
jgi:4-hydroxy-tetrahydrodipicolinate reductase